MCQTIKDSTMSAATMTSLVAPSARSFKRCFKPRTARKASAPTRIGLNRFWNELEEFYNRYDDRRARNLGKDLIQGNSLPAYTTDTFDHEREAAENALNERLEAAARHQQPPALPPKMTACSCQHQQQLPSPPPCDSIDSIFGSDKVKNRQMNYSVDSEVDSSFGSLTSSDNEDEDLDEVFFTTNPTDHLPHIPRPPRTLLDLIQRMSVGGADL